MLEQQIENYITRKAQALGCISYKFTSPGNPGVPDRIIITPEGQTIYVELKATWGRLANIQKYQMEKIRKQGSEVYVVKGMEAAVEFIRELKERLL